MTKVSLSDIRAEKIKREKKKRKKFRKKFAPETKFGFWSYCKYMDEEFFYDEKTVLKNLAEILRKALIGEINGKVIISIFPRAGKSYMISLYSVWSLGHNPRKTIMRNTYGGKLADKFSRDIRNIIGIPGEKETLKNKKNKRIFPELKLSKDKTAAAEWALDTAKDVSYFCGGVGGAVTGYGCNLLAILDDPIKNWEESLSDNKLKSIEEWYQSTHLTRIEQDSGCVEIIIMTRWAEEDTAGLRLYFEPESWTSYTFPALVKGKSICEAMVSTKALLKKKSALIKAGLEAIWNALYQQNPTDARGKLFPSNELTFKSRAEFNKLPDTYKINFTDFADKGSDYFCSPVGQVVEDKIWITDVIFTKDPIEITEGRTIALFLKHKIVRAIFEANSGGRGFALNIKKAIRKKLKTRISTKYSVSNKKTRIFSWSGVIKETFIFVREEDSNQEYKNFIKNLTSYHKEGKNKNDDAPDALSGLATMIGVGSGIQVKILN